MLRTWCTPEKNARFVEEHLGRPATNYHFSEHRYFHGQGGPVGLKPSGHRQALRENLWLAAHTGAGFFSLLHLMAAWGLPPTATVKAQPGGTILFSATNFYNVAHRWQRDFMVGPAYGINPAVWNSQTELRPAFGCFPRHLRPASCRHSGRFSWRAGDLFRNLSSNKQSVDTLPSPPALPC